VRTSSLSSVVFWKEHVFNIVIEFVQVDIAKYWRDHAALWASAQASVIFPVLKISCLKEVRYQPKETVIFPLFS